MMVAGRPQGYSYCLGMNLHAVKAGCSVACLEVGWAEEERFSEIHSAKEARRGIGTRGEIL